MSIVLITGANRGIGYKTAELLAAKGHTVYLGSRNHNKGVAAAATITGDIHPLQLDVDNADDIHRAVAEIESRHGHLDVLINNAAIDYDSDQRATQLDLERLQRQLDTNLLAPIAVAKACLPLLRKSEHPRIVNVSSEAGSLSSTHGTAPGYGITKAALNFYTTMLARELSADGILTNAICPGWTATDMGGSGGRPVEQGAQSVIWAATLPDDGPTGGFFRNGKRLDW